MKKILIILTMLASAGLGWAGPGMHVVIYNDSDKAIQLNTLDYLRWNVKDFSEIDKSGEHYFKTIPAHGKRNFYTEFTQVPQDDINHSMTIHVVGDDKEYPKAKFYVVSNSKDKTSKTTLSTYTNTEAEEYTLPDIYPQATAPKPLIVIKFDGERFSLIKTKVTSNVDIESASGDVTKDKDNEYYLNATEGGSTAKITFSNGSYLTAITNDYWIDTHLYDGYGNVITYKCRPASDIVITNGDSMKCDEYNPEQKVTAVKSDRVSYLYVYGDGCLSTPLGNIVQLIPGATCRVWALDDQQQPYSGYTEIANQTNIYAEVNRYSNDGHKIDTKICNPYGKVQIDRYSVSCVQ